MLAACATCRLAVQAPILYLRPMAALRSLNLAGNPLCLEEGYETHVIAYVPQLRYLDYRRISAENVCRPHAQPASLAQRNAARAQFLDKLEILEAKVLRWAGRRGVLSSAGGGAGAGAGGRGRAAGP